MCYFSHGNGSLMRSFKGTGFPGFLCAVLVGSSLVRACARAPERTLFVCLFVGVAPPRSTGRSTRSTTLPARVVGRLALRVALASGKSLGPLNHSCAV